MFHRLNSSDLKLYWCPVGNCPFIDDRMLSLQCMALLNKSRGRKTVPSLQWFLKLQMALIYAIVHG